MIIKPQAAQYFFQNKKYLPISEFVDEDVATIISEKYVQLAKEDTENKLNDIQCPVNSKAWYGQPMCEFLMLDCLPKMELLTGLHLKPTYTYMRVYGIGEELHRHVDRPSCEISVTLNLGQSSDFDWPIWYSDPKDVTVRMPVSCQPREAMIYRGCEVPHWREPFNPPNKEDWQVQVFMHYVDMHGPYSHFAYDSREQLMIQPIGESKTYEEYGAMEPTDHRKVRYTVVEE